MIAIYSILFIPERVITKSVIHVLMCFLVCSPRKPVYDLNERLCYTNTVGVRLWSHPRITRAGKRGKGRSKKKAKKPEKPATKPTRVGQPECTFALASISHEHTHSRPQLTHILTSAIKHILTPFPTANSLMRTCSHLLARSYSQVSARTAKKDAAE